MQYVKTSDVGDIDTFQRLKLWTKPVAVGMVRNKYTKENLGKWINKNE